MKKKAITKRAAPKKPTKKADVPSLFRLNIEVGDLDAAAQFYGKLFDLKGRIQAGSRVYFTCGALTMQVVDVSSSGRPHPAAQALYFLVNDLETVFDRAPELRSLSTEDVHGLSGGAIAVRPWGEHSFYAEIRGEIRCASSKPARPTAVESALRRGVTCCNVERAERFCADSS